MALSIFIAVLFMLIKASSCQYGTFLNEINEKLNVEKYIYIYDTYDNDFSESLFSLKYKYKELRVFLYNTESLEQTFYETDQLESNKTSVRSFNFYWYNIFCHLIQINPSGFNDSQPNIVFFIQNFNLLYKLQGVLPCFDFHHLVFVFENVNGIDNGVSITLNSITFSIWKPSNDSYNITYLDANLHIIDSYSSFGNVTFSMIQASRGVILPKKCLCSNGQVRLRIGVIERPFYRFENEDNDVQEDLSYEKFAKELFNEIANALKISYEVVPCIDNEIGTKNENGWSGLVGMLIRDEIDVAVSSIRIDTQRSNEIEFTYPFLSDTYGMLMHATKPFQYSVLDVFLPFSYELWLCILTSILVVGIILHLFYRFDIFFSNYNSIDHSNTSFKHHDIEFSIRKCLTFSFARLFGQNLDYHTNHIPSRIIVVVWWLFAITIMASYTANLTAFLASNERDIIIDKLETLADSSANFKPLIYKGTNAENSFKFSEDKTKKKIWNRFENDKNLRQNNRTVSDLLKNKDYIFIGETSLLRYYSSFYCDLVKSNEEFDLSEFAFGLQKNSPFRDELSNYIIRLREGGITDLILKEEINNDEIGLCDEQNINMTEIDSFYGILLTLAASIFTGFLILIAEIFIHRNFYDKTTGRYNFKKIFKNRGGFSLNDSILSMKTQRTTIKTVKYKENEN